MSEKEKISLKRWHALLLASFMLMGFQPAGADIYKYRDRQGRIYFTDRPMKGDYRFLGFSGRSRQSTAFEAAKYRRNRARFGVLIDETARRADLRPALLHAVVRAESSYDPRALSRKGAAGLMQLMPETARRYGINDRWNPRQNLDAGARHLRDLLETFRFDLKLALAAYNAGENAVRRYGNRIPPFPETQRYVRKVLSFYNQGGNRR